MGCNRWVVPRDDLGRMDRRTLSEPICDRYCLVFLGVATILAVVSAGRLALALSLVPFGFFNGLIDVSMNSQAAAFEQRTGRSVMSSFHASVTVWADCSGHCSGRRCWPPRSLH